MMLRSKNAVSIYSFAVLMIVYIITANPDLAYTDSGELAGVCVTLGISHPTGYPLFTILGHLWSLQPLPITKIYSLNLFASVLTALSAWVFFHLIYEVLKGLHFRKKGAHNVKGKPDTKPIHKKQLADGEMILISLASTLTYGLGLIFWGQANSIEVYPLQLLLINSVLFFIIKASTGSENKRYLLIAAFLIGLSFSNHLTTILIIPAVLFYYFYTQDGFNFSPDSWKFLAILLLPFVIGLSFYLYMPLRSSMEPLFNWGYVSRGWDKFIYHVQGKQYQVWMFSDPEIMKQNFGKFFSAMPYQLGWIGFIPFLYGLYLMARRMPRLFWFCMILLVSCLAYTLNYSIHDIETYFATAYISILIVTAIGIAGFSLIKKELTYFSFIIPLILLITNFPMNDRSDDYLVREYTKVTSNSLGKDAIIISAQWDYWCSAFWYMQTVEHQRKDVVLLEKELLRRTWYPYQFKRWNPEIYQKSQNEFNLYLEFLDLFESEKPFDPQALQLRFINLIRSVIDKNIDSRPIYVTPDVIQTDPDIVKGYTLVPDGFALRIEKVPGNYKVKMDQIQLDRFIKSLRKEENHLDEGIRKSASMNLANLGRYAVGTGQFEEAARAYSLSLRLDNTNVYAIDGMNLLNSRK
jgi:hypothetical protein